MAKLVIVLEFAVAGLAPAARPGIAAFAGAGRVTRTEFKAAAR